VEEETEKLVEEDIEEENRNSVNDGKTAITETREK
jgi:hypothetical protein